MTFPFSMADIQQSGLGSKVLEYLKLLQENNALLKKEEALLQESFVLLKEQEIRQQERIDALEAEIVRLKKLNPKPDIKPNTKPSDDDPEDGLSDQSGTAEDGDNSDNSDPDVEQPEVDKPNEKTRRKRQKPPKPSVDKEVPVSVPTEDIPSGSTRNGHSSFDVQELEIKTGTIRYQLEQWVTPDGNVITASPPESLQGHHFGPDLQCTILHHYFSLGTTQHLLLEWLWDMGISISAGELSYLLTVGHEQFHQEKDELLVTGIRCSQYLQTDDTGARHQGKNGFCTVIGNESFTWYGSTDSKSRKNFFSLLHRPFRTYTLTEDVLVYWKEHKYPEKWLRKFRQYIGVTFLNEKAWEAFMKDIGLTGKLRRQNASEALIYASLIHHGFSRNMFIFSDGARQFNVFDHAQCWLHAECPLAKVHPVTEQQAQAQYWCRTWFWEIYTDLKAYKKSPSEEKAEQIRIDFRSLIHTETNCTPLQEALGGLAVIEKELLKVLDNPSLPQHNNLSESQIREHVKRRKVSGGTRSDAGRQSRDTFASLKKTCRLYGLSFWDYLKSRLMGDGFFPILGDLIEEGSHHLPCGVSSSF